MQLIIFTFLGGEGSLGRASGLWWSCRRGLAGRGRGFWLGWADLIFKSVSWGKWAVGTDGKTRRDEARWA